MAVAPPAPTASPTAYPTAEPTKAPATAAKKCDALALAVRTCSLTRNRCIYEGSTNTGRCYCVTGFDETCTNACDSGYKGGHAAATAFCARAGMRLPTLAELEANSHPESGDDKPAGLVHSMASCAGDNAQQFTSTACTGSNGDPGFIVAFVQDQKWNHGPAVCETDLLRADLDVRCIAEE
jgi:hypothetical protein